MMNFSVLLNNISAISDRYRAMAELSGENFNLFRIVGLTSDEVRVHSAFLANLLNPKGSHGQKDIFLKLFVEMVGIDSFLCENAKVKIEKWIGAKSTTEGGRVDILITDTNGFQIIIENKIYAGDQENQLIRYRNSVSDKSKLKLFYLTLEGDMPDEEKSCRDQVNGIELKVDEDYQLLSYRKDIIEWLEHCREKATTKPLLREGVTHYINLLKYLTNQNIHQEMNKEIVELLSQPANIKNLHLLSKGIVETQIVIQKKFWNLLIEEFRKKGFDISTKTCTDTFIEEYYSKSRDYKYYGIEIRLGTKGNVLYRYGIRIDEYIYGGFTLRDIDKKQLNCAQPEYTSLVSIVKRIDPDYKSNDYWMGWKVLKPELYFKYPTNETYKRLANLEDTISDMIEAICMDIKRFWQEIKIDSEHKMDQI